MAFSTEYNVNNQVKGVNGFGLPFCKKVYTAKLAANTETHMTIPGLSAIGVVNSTAKALWIAVFSYTPTLDTWVAINHTAAVPAGSTLAAELSELNPTGKLVQEGDVLSMISPGTPNVSVALYSIQVG